jgi:hypothetical protein
MPSCAKLLHDGLFLNLFAAVRKRRSLPPPCRATLLGVVLRKTALAIYPQAFT